MVTACQWIPVRLTVVSMHATRLCTQGDEECGHLVLRNGPGQANRNNAADKLLFLSNNRVV